MTVTDHLQMSEALRRAGFHRVTETVDGVRTVSWVGRLAGEDIVLPDDLSTWSTDEISSAPAGESKQPTDAGASESPRERK